MTATLDTVRLDLGPRSYDILVGDGVLSDAGERIAAITRGAPPSW